MRAIQSIKDLEIPTRYQTYILKYLENISDIPYVSRVILFGSCAKGTVTKYSDIDLFVTVNREISLDEEFLISSDRLPDLGDYLSTDILVQSEDTFNRFTDTTCAIQKQVNYYGVDLSEFIPKRPRN